MCIRFCYEYSYCQVQRLSSSKMSITALRQRLRSLRLIERGIHTIAIRLNDLELVFIN